MAQEFCMLPSALISNLCCWLKFSWNPKKELTFHCFIAAPSSTQMRPISCYIATITHAQNMQPGQSRSITYVTLICGSAWGEAIGDDTLCSRTMAWADWSSDGSQIGRFQWTATERNCTFIPLTTITRPHSDWQAYEHYKRLVSILNKI